MTAFADLGLSKDALLAVEKLGYDQPTPVPVSYSHLTLPTT